MKENEGVSWTGNTGNSVRGYWIIVKLWDMQQLRMLIPCIFLEKKVFRWPYMLAYKPPKYIINNLLVTNILFTHIIYIKIISVCLCIHMFFYLNAWKCNWGITSLIFTTWINLGGKTGKLMIFFLAKKHETQQQQGHEIITNILLFIAH